MLFADPIEAHQLLQSGHAGLLIKCQLGFLLAFVPLLFALVRGTDRLKGVGPLLLDALDLRPETFVHYHVFLRVFVLANEAFDFDFLAELFVIFSLVKES